MSYNMTDQQIEISRGDENNQITQSNIEQQQQEYMKSLCDNFLLFIDQINHQSRVEQQSQKKKIQKKNKIQKKKSTTKQRKKSRSKSECQQTSQQVHQQTTIQQNNYYQKEFDNLIKQGMSVNDIHYLIDLLQKQQHETIIEELRIRYPKLLESYRRELKNSQIKQGSRQCFTNYLQKHGLEKGQMPPNCLHINICYYIWEKQGKTNIDPTLSGRERKSQQMQNKLSEDQKIQNISKFFMEFFQR